MIMTNEKKRPLRRVPLPAPPQRVIFAHMNLTNLALSLPIKWQQEGDFLTHYEGMRAPMVPSLRPNLQAQNHTLLSESLLRTGKMTEK